MRLRRLLPSRGPVLVVNVGLVLALVAGTAWAYSMVTEPAASADEATVSTVPVMQGTVTATVSADGAVESASTASASFETSGTVTEILVQVGQAVKKGEILAKVDRTAADRGLDAAEADLAAAQSALDRAADAGEDTSAATNEVTSAELAVEEAQDEVDGTVLRAPMGGTVVAVNGTLGGAASGSSGSSGSNGSNGSSGGGTAGQPEGDTGGTSDGSTGTGSGFIDIADLSKLQVAAAFAETDATKLATDQAATVTWNALPDTEVSATVAAIDPNATTSGNEVTYRTVLDLETLPEGVRVGQTVSVSVVTATVDNALYVNAAAIERVGNRRTVTVLENGVQTARSVEVGVESDQFVEVTSGLSVGEQVVVTIETGEGETGLVPGGPGGGGFPGGGGLTGGGMPGGGGPPAGGGR